MAPLQPAPRTDIAARSTWGTQRRSWPLGLLATGLVLVVVGFVYDLRFAGIPDQDPTPAMAADFAHHARVASLIRGTGLLVALAGIAAGFARPLARRAR